MSVARGLPPNGTVLPYRIVMLDPIPGVVLRLQSGRHDLVPPTSETAARVVFDFELRVGKPGADGAMVFLGAAAQGSPRDRFVYVNAGRQAGQGGSGWDRRAKIPLCGVSRALVDAVIADPAGCIEVRVAARGRDGGPVCATVKLPTDAWRVSPQKPA